MLKAKLATGLCIVMLALTTINCSGRGGGDVTAPNPVDMAPNPVDMASNPVGKAMNAGHERNAQYFNEAGPLFVDGDYLGVDMAVVKSSHDIPALITVDSVDTHLTVAVTLQIVALPGIGEIQVPYLAWLKQPTSVPSAPDILERRSFGSSGTEVIDFKCPHVTA